jgi:NAD(P)-dependent dehydrogenase (short-subunit alcohol dehydrogenase family)
VTNDSNAAQSTAAVTRFLPVLNSHHNPAIEQDVAAPSRTRANRIPVDNPVERYGFDPMQKEIDMAGTEISRALIVGAGQGLSAALARLFSRYGMQVALASRDPRKLEALCTETGARAFGCDASRQEEVQALFAQVNSAIGDPDVVVYNASGRVRGPFVDLDPAQVQRAIAVTAYGGFLVAQEAARRMLPKNNGAILFTGASASIKGYPQSAAFAMGKFALRGLAQSLARELMPQGIHIAHFVIDGGIAQPGRTPPIDKPDALLDPDAIAVNYLHVLRQPRSAWTWEIELRPWVETF